MGRLPPSVGKDAAARVLRWRGGDAGPAPAFLDMHLDLPVTVWVAAALCTAGLEKRRTHRYPGGSGNSMHIEHVGQCLSPA